MGEQQHRLQTQAITHDNGEPCRLIPCKECGDSDHELCECDMLRCEQCDQHFCHDHAFNDRDGNGSFCHDCGYGWLTYRKTVEITEEVKRLRAALTELDAMVRGECPSLLNEDSGGNAELAIEIESLLGPT